MVPVVDIHLAQQKARSGDLDGAIGLARAVLDDLFDSGGAIWSVLATTVLVEALLRRGADGDLQDAQTEIDRLAAVPTDPGFVLHEIWLLRLRALLARARGDEAGYRDFRDRYRAMATELWLRGAHGAGRGDDMTAAGTRAGLAAPNWREIAKFCSECGAPIAAVTSDRRSTSR